MVSTCLSARSEEPPGTRPVSTAVYIAAKLVCLFEVEINIRCHICMKMITINVNETVYRRFQDSAARRNQTASQMIRDAMASYAEEVIPNETSIFDHPPASVGSIYRLPSADDDLLGEMLS